MLSNVSMVSGIDLPIPRKGRIELRRTGRAGVSRRRNLGVISWDLRYTVGHSRDCLPRRVFMRFDLPTWGIPRTQTVPWVLRIADFRVLNDVDGDISFLAFEDCVMKG